MTAWEDAEETRVVVGDLNYIRDELLEFKTKLLDRPIDETWQTMAFATNALGLLIERIVVGKVLPRKPRTRRRQSP